MPKRTDIKSILILGSGPIVIGQACEFDYSGTQGLKALREDGYRLILVNSNPATIMTDPDLSDRTYIEPLTPEALERIIQDEKPDALLPTLGGQTALNLAVALSERGVLKRHGVELIGAPLEAIQKAEDRQRFKTVMQKTGLDIPKSLILTDAGEIHTAARELGFPIIVRPSFTLGGTGGGITYNLDELRERVHSALDASPVKKVLLEESVIGWKEYELEVMRDAKDNFVVICSIENLDPMGVHTGDSITVAPAQTLTDRQYQAMRDDAKSAICAIGVETGGCNVQFAVDPKTGRRVVIEINPRVSRSSALASKATGFPIAKFAAKLAVGYTLDEIPNDITKKTPAAFEPTIDYVVTKIPRFAFEKFGREFPLDTAMKSVGEVMAMGRTFKESFQKALRGLETGRAGFEDLSPNGRKRVESLTEEKLLRNLALPYSDRLFYVREALRRGLAPREIANITGIDPWFLDQLKDIMDAEAELAHGKLDAKRLREAKSLGFSDTQIARATKKTEQAVRALRKRLGVTPSFKRVDTCAAEFDATTPYFYSTYDEETESVPSKKKKKIAILGSGPNRIGQGIEFDYACVHAVLALRELGYETVMINCNPETVSTDYDISDRLYFEPLTFEDVMEVLDLEKPEGVIVQFGGQTPLNLTKKLAAAGVKILGTSPKSTDVAEDRRRCGALLKKLGIPAPEYGIAKNLAEAKKIAHRIGYPVMVRPSYVLGGRAMEVVYDDAGLRDYGAKALAAAAHHPELLIDRFLSDAAEIDVDAVSDGKDVFIGGVMEHIEEAGIHSGDSACTLPARSMTPGVKTRIVDYTRRIARALDVVGMINMQYAVKDNVVYLLEANPRASRTVPFISKATGLPFAKIAAKAIAGTPLKKLLHKSLLERGYPDLPYAATKEVVLPFLKFPGIDPMLGPEMKSTGEVMGIARDFPSSFAKAQAATGMSLPTSGIVFISVRDEDKAAILPIAAQLRQLGFSLVATRSTQAFLARHAIEAERVYKLEEGKPDVVDLIKQRTLSLVINTPSGKRAKSDGFAIRRTSLELGVPILTNVNSCQALVQGIATVRGRKSVSSIPLQDLYKELDYPVS
ncbi:MAG: carbamoyl phosphate synthase large subunit [Elusimicrobia bacterium CG1_02_63_36]|nr:MAG: carbamoyl phosphate synthase large subunit [Elusimicrobia bacterium CG1_02_63_36]PIP81868.1 MAG: carbamoyl phosphate synthase large subunit [Elusimicrobia bacterium CG22_combo_CG10-13_8_21_14_all_63_91]PJA12598.1 MAG: carbamoyl phosphate synthase large subunit [Elusimicrobia bacterium CG_4_10_14_0_2_um_filter_63_34]PJB25155.1 MAG: carbamoyl phosphate synthase large subunit [Elusimicrobia bacterium CG_4_9_14_3_um_filter_62_55]